MQKLIKYIASVLSKESDASSKRFFGAIGFICSIIFIGVWEHSLINELLYVSSGLIGLTLFERK